MFQKGTPLGRSEMALESILRLHPLSLYGSKAKIAQKGFILRPRVVLGVWWVFFRRHHALYACERVGEPESVIDDGGFLRR